LRIRALTARSFRNLEPATVRFSAGVNLVLGSNGEGKTNLLEAIAVLANIRSFRTTRWATVASFGSKGFSLLGEVEREGAREELQQVVEVGPPVRRELKVNNGRVGVEDYLCRSPVVALTSADGALVVGSPAHRRGLVDRMAFLLEPATLGEVRDFLRALRQRNAALSGAAADEELEVWEGRLAEHAARVVVRRFGAVESLARHFAPTYARLRSEGFPDITLSYRSEAWLKEPESPKKLAESYRKRYNTTRVRDRLTGHTMEGPHRHDLRLEANGRPAREVLSSGQIKVVAAALRLAALGHVEQQRGERLPVIVDDVDAELDSAVFERLTRTLASRRQLFLSSAHGEMVSPLFAGAHILTMTAGSCGGPTAGGD
jgi:DNA replication and repair protein RecF